MSMSSTEGATREAYCDYCEQTQAIRMTVPWQSDICTVCNNAVEDSS
ncbi:hypothetical protein [Halarchaeum sp. P4]